jgi:hypothetical protein
VMRASRPPSPRCRPAGLRRRLAALAATCQTVREADPGPAPRLCRDGDGRRN